MTLRDLLMAADDWRATRDSLDNDHSLTGNTSYWKARRAYVDIYGTAWEAARDLRSAVADFSEDMNVATFDRLVAAIQAAQETM